MSYGIPGVAPTAIIVGAEPRKLVTIARSLHRVGVRCIVATPRGQPLQVSSRALAGAAWLGDSVEESAGLLVRLAHSESAGWAVPTSDTALQIVCAAYHELTRVCAVGCPPPSIVQRVLDKTITLAIAERNGVPVPRSMTIARATELEAALHEMRFPIVVKHADKSRESSHDFKTRTFTSADELRSVFASEPRFGEGLLFQTYHGGQGVGVELLMSGGEVVTSFQHRRVSENPPSGGVAVVAVAEAVDPKLLEYATRLLRALEWEGVAMVEFRHDAATGDTALMEVNGRFWGSLPLNTAAGVDFPLYAWQLSQGITPVPPASYPVGLRVRWTAGSLLRAGHVLTGLPEDRITIGNSLRQLAADFAPGTRSAMWSWRDPAPAVQEVVHVLSRWTKDGVKSVLRAIIPRPLLSIVKDSRRLERGRRITYVRRRLLRTMGLNRAISLPRPADSVLFVCHGNIMRSAAAAAALREELRTLGLSTIRVALAGTHAHDGRPADLRARDAAQHLALSLNDHRATRLTPKLVSAYDVIFAMDELNYVNIAMTYPEAREKLQLFGGMHSSGTYRAHEIADPYTSSPDEVKATIAMVKHYAAPLAQALRAAHATRAPARTATTGREHGVGAEP